MEYRCPLCGTELNLRLKECPNCGQPLFNRKKKKSCATDCKWIWCWWNNKERNDPENCNLFEPKIKI